MMCRADGLPSLTEYNVLKTVANGAFVECVPRSGRQHQIRIHLAHMGHPILGDKMYGPDPDLFLDYLEQGLTAEIEQRAGARRHLLHAASLSFTHPITGKTQLIESPLPADMQAIVS
jgi:23S rRNA pseudouridine1911/1915/1917 synthase